METGHPRGNITTKSYDATRRPTGLITAFNYDPGGHIILTTQSAKGSCASEHKRDMHADPLRAMRIDETMAADDLLSQKTPALHF